MQKLLTRRTFMESAAIFAVNSAPALKLVGPILSFPTPYNADLRIDLPCVRRMIELGRQAGSSVFTLTAGNNQYDRLTYEEIKQLTRFTVEAAGGRGMTIAATGPWWTGQAVEYARYAKSVGADALQVLLPPRGDDDSFFEHMRTIARATPLPLVLQAQPSMALLEKLVTLESFVALKEEFTTDYTVPVFRRFGGRLNIFAGGTKARFLSYLPYGMRAYYSAFATFAPSVAVRFWRAVEKKDIDAAGAIVLKYDAPFFERWSHPFWRATLEVFGLGGRFVRPPERALSDQQIKEAAAFYKGLGLL